MESNDEVIRDAIIGMMSSQDNDEIQYHNNILMNAMRQPVQFIFSLNEILTQYQTDSRMIYHVIINLGNTLSARTHSLKYYENQWVQVPEENRNFLKENLIRLLTHENVNIRHNVGYCISRLYRIEEMNNLWPNFYEFLFENIRMKSHGEIYVESYLHILLELYFQDSVIKDETFQVNIFQVLNEYISNQSTPIHVRIICFRILHTGIPYFDFIIKCQEENIHRFIRNILPNFSIDNIELHELLYEIVQIFISRYFDIIQDDLRSIYNVIYYELISNIFQKRKLSINLLASIACSEYEHHNHNFVLNSYQVILPVLLKNLLVQNLNELSSDNNEEFILVKHSINCLNFYLEAEPDIIFPILIKFIEENINGNEIQQLSTLYAIYISLKHNFLPNYINFIMDKCQYVNNNIIQETSLFLLKTILQIYPNFISEPKYFNILLNILLQILNNNQYKNIIKRIFEILFFLFKCFDTNEKQIFLSSQFELIWNIYLTIFSTDVYRDHYIIVSIFESFNSFINHLSVESKDNVENIIKFIFQFIENEKENPKENQIEILTFLCSVISTIILRCRSFIGIFIDEIMAHILPLLEIQDFELYCEIIIIFNSLCLLFRADFIRYYPNILEPIRLVYNSGNFRVMSYVSTFLADLYNDNNQQLQFLDQYIDAFFTKSIETLKLPYLPKYYRVTFLNCTSALASKMKHHYIRIFDEIFLIIYSIQQENIDITQPDQRDYCFDIFEAILYSYNICIQICDDKEHIMLNMKQILDCFEIMLRYSSYTQKSLHYFVKILYLLVNRCGYKFTKYLTAKEYIKPIMDMVFLGENEQLKEELQRTIQQIDLCQLRKY